MKRLHFSSFRQRLNAAFLAVSLVPMLLCSGLLLQIFRLRMTSNAQQQLSASCEALDTLHSGFLQTAASLQHNPLVAQALFDAEAEDTAVYSQLFDATESVRSFARFDLYDISGRWRYSTQTAPEIRSLPTNWGLLYEAACAGTGVLVCSAAEDPADTDEPLLHAAMLLTDRYGAPVGYLTIGMLETQLRTLLGGTAGAQNELLLLDARWRPVYCTQPAQTQSLARAAFVRRGAHRSVCRRFLYRAAAYRNRSVSRPAAAAAAQRRNTPAFVLGERAVRAGLHHFKRRTQPAAKPAGLPTDRQTASRHPAGREK